MRTGLAASKSDARRVEQGRRVRERAAVVDRRRRSTDATCSTAGSCCSGAGQARIATSSILGEVDVRRGRPVVLSLRPGSRLQHCRRAAQRGDASRHQRPLDVCPSLLCVSVRRTLKTEERTKKPVRAIRSARGRYQVNALTDDEHIIRCRSWLVLAGSATEPPILGVRRRLFTDRRPVRRPEISTESLILAQDERWRRA